MSPEETSIVQAGGYTGPIFDCDTHIHESNFDFFKEYLPKEYHHDLLLARRVGPEGFGLYIGDRKVHNAEANVDGLVPPPGALKEWLKAIVEERNNWEWSEVGGVPRELQ